MREACEQLNGLDSSKRSFSAGLLYPEFVVNASLILAQATWRPIDNTSGGLYMAVWLGYVSAVLTGVLPDFYRTDSTPHQVAWVGGTLNTSVLLCAPILQAFAGLLVLVVSRVGCILARSERVATGGVSRLSSLCCSAHPSKNNC